MIRQIINAIALSIVLLINYLANALPLNNQTTGEVSNRLEVLITPAGYTFSIWGLIYTLLVFWVIRGFFRKYRESAVYIQTSPLFVLSCILNSLWIILWHYEFFGLTVLVMVSLLLTLIYIYIALRKFATKLLDYLPFSIYLGWISVATIVNISYYLVEINWNAFGLSAVFWTTVMLIIATLLAIYFRIKNNDFFFPLVFVWAFIGIAVKNLQPYPSIAYLAFILAGIVFVIALFGNKKEMFIQVIK